MHVDSDVGRYVDGDLGSRSASNTGANIISVRDGMPQQTSMSY